MSLDDKVLNERLVNLTVDGLETVHMASERIAEGNFPEDHKKIASAYIRDHDQCLMQQRPSPELRESFGYIAGIMTMYARSPAHNLLNFVKGTSAAGGLYGLISMLVDVATHKDPNLSTITACIGLAGFALSHQLQDYLDMREVKSLSADAKQVADAPDDIWKVALSILYDKKFGRDYSD